MMKMNLSELDRIACLYSELKDVQFRQEKNQRAQVTTNLRIQELEAEIDRYYQRQSQIDPEVAVICDRAEALKTKLELLKRIYSFAQKFQQLQKEFQNNQELLDTLYVSIFSVAE
jgi:predicted  nucleic acid-binding Zn-ribbon protein